MSKKQLIQEINRTREIMGLSTIIEQTSTGGTEDNSSVFADTDIDIDKKVKKPSARQLKKELKNKWKFEVFNILDGIQEGDVFGFNEFYSLQQTDKVNAVLTMLQNLMCVNAKIARTVILAEDNVYDASKLMTTAQFPKGGGHEGLIDTIENNIKRLDKKFKLGRGGMKVDKKLRPIRKQLKEARKGLNALIPYVDWDGYSKKMGYQANSTEDILLNSKNLNKHHRDCANQLNPPTRSNDLLSR